MKKHKNSLLILSLVLVISSISFIYADTDNSHSSDTTAITDCEHDWSYYFHDDEKHEKQCNKCNEIKHEDHLWGPETSDDSFCSTKECTLCLYNISELHDINYNYQHDSQYHWYTCKKCSRQVNKFEHNFEYLNHDDVTHKLVCNYCQYSPRTERHNFVLKSLGDRGHRYECVMCNREEEVRPHKISIKSVDKNNHRKECTECSYEGPLENHSWVNGICSQCGEQECTHDTTVAMGAGSFEHAIICTSGCLKILRTEPHNFETNALGYTYCVDCGVSKNSDGGF